MACPISTLLFEGLLASPDRNFPQDPGLPLEDPGCLSTSLSPTRAVHVRPPSRGSPRATHQRGFTFCEAAWSADFVPTPAPPGATANGVASASMAPRALTVFVSGLASTYARPDTQRRPHMCPPRLRKPGCWSSAASQRDSIRPLAEAWDARGPHRPCPVGLQAKPGAATARQFSGGGAAN